jgi:hypothetical protein
VRIEREAAHHQPRERRVRIGGALEDRPHAARPDRSSQLVAICLRVRRCAGEQLVEHHAEGVQIGSHISRLTVPLLWRHVARSTEHVARRPGRACSSRLIAHIADRRSLAQISPRWQRPVMHRLGDSDHWQVLGLGDVTPSASMQRFEAGHRRLVHERFPRLARRGKSREPEVDQPWDAVVVEHDIRRLDVAVQDPASMRSLESMRDADRQLAHFPPWHWSRDAIQALAADQLLDQEWAAVIGGADTIDRDDVRVR